MISSKRKIYLTLLSFAILCILIMGFGFSPIFSSIKNSAQDLALKKATLELLESRLSSSKQFQENYPILKRELSKIEDSFIALEAPIGFMEFLESEAQKTNLEMVVSPLSFLSTGSDPWSSVGFRVMVGGRFSDCSRFLERLEQSPWLIEIYRLNIERISERVKGATALKNLTIGNVVFTFHLKAFSGKIPSEEK